MAKMAGEVADMYHACGRPGGFREAGQQENRRFLVRNPGFRGRITGL